MFENSKTTIKKNLIFYNLTNTSKNIIFLCFFINNRKLKNNINKLKNVLFYIFVYLKNIEYSKLKL